ncbi:uncharacterized protein [Epargyreus clarus]|uniref:uncharacterized protein n=1 Tax=Epargyreus clarus TaxID=520877 RepID=UPI003C2AAF39
MDRIFQIILICYIGLILYVAVDRSEAHKVHRQRRYLVFENISHFFVRVNYKANMVPWNQIFAQAIGFRLNYDEPPDSYHPYHHIYRRTAYSHLETILERSGLNGFHCVRRAICEIAMMPKAHSLYHRVLKIVFTPQTSATEKWHNATKEDCWTSMASCPFSMLDVSTFTDL